MPASAVIASLGGVNVSLFFRAEKKPFQLHALAAVLSCGEIKLAHASTSIWEGRTRYMPLMAEDPPSTFPRGHGRDLAARLGCGTVEYAQS